MSPWQVVQQLAWLIANRHWPETSGERVVANAIPTVGIAEEVLGTVRSGPLCLLKPGGRTADPENPRLLTMEVLLTLAVKVGGDKTGKAALVGGARSAETVASSEGRGLLEIEEEILEPIAAAAGASGVNVQVAWAGSPAVGRIGEQAVAVCEYGMRVLCTRHREYAAPRALAYATGVLTWTLPADRFDRSAVFLRKAAGGTPPASITDGTDVTLSGPLATTVSGQSAGTSYALFMGYDEGRGSALRYSSAQVGSTLVVP